MKICEILVVCSLLTLMSIPGFGRTASAGKGEKTGNPAEEKSRLKGKSSDLYKILIIGDSISNGYTPFVREYLSDVAVVEHNEGNARDTDWGVAQIETWLGDTDWDLIHFNWGLWDLRHDGGMDSLSRVSLFRYVENLRQLVARLKKTGAVLVWATTTPVPAGCGRRFEGMEYPYNRAAEGVMRENDISINDLHALVLPDLQNYQRPANVHFFTKGSELLARQVADTILKKLGL
jgi:acyl-CoA thioesterase-1